jgi:hypothetical protein
MISGNVGWLLGHYAHFNENPYTDNSYLWGGGQAPGFMDVIPNSYNSLLESKDIIP